MATRKKAMKKKAAKKKAARRKIGKLIETGTNYVRGTRSASFTEEDAGRSLDRYRRRKAKTKRGPDDQGNPKKASGRGSRKVESR